MSINEKRNNLNLLENRVAISKADFQKLFTKTKETITFTFNGWDGKSYDGETRKATVLKTNIEGLENIKFIKVGKGIHYITEEMVLDKTTKTLNPEAAWFIDVSYKT